MHRYSAQAFPPYAFIPGIHPHPRQNPRGHSSGRPDLKPKPVRPEDWRSSDDYLYALDLCNFGYWWECHEVLEGLWHAVGTKTEQGSFFQALVDLAAGNLKQSTGEHESATKLWSYALTRLERLPSPYMGLDLRGLESEIRSRLADPSLPPIVLRLHF